MDNKYYILSEQGVTNLVYHYRLIEQFAPTMLLVEHDAAFREKIATKVVEL
ncbi:MAG: hypothetical protein ACLRLD_04625 [Lachnospira sp.]